MTVGELRNLLANYHDATLVVVDGYEDGYDDPQIRLARVVHLSEGRDEWWSGVYRENTQSGIEAVVVGR